MVYQTVKLVIIELNHNRQPVNWTKNSLSVKTKALYRTHHRTIVIVPKTNYTLSLDLLANLLAAAIGGDKLKVN